MRSVEWVDQFPHIPHSSFICLNSVNLIKLKIETIPNWGISYYFIPNALNAASTGVEYTSKLN